MKKNTSWVCLLFLPIVIAGLANVLSPQMAIVTGLILILTIYFLISPVALLLFFAIFGSIYLERIVGPLEMGGVSLHVIEMLWFEAIALMVLSIAVLRNRLVFPRFLVPLVMLIILSGVSLIYSKDISLGLRYTMQLLFMLLMCLLPINLKLSEKELRQIWTFFILGFLIQSIAALYQLFHPTNVEFGYSGLVRAEGLTGSGNGLAFLNLFIGSYFVARSLTTVGKSRTLHAVLSVVSIIIIFFTQTRAAIIIMVVMGAMIIFLTKVPQKLFIGKINKGFLIIICACIILVLFLTTTLPSLTVSRFSVNSGSVLSLPSYGTWEHRTYVWGYLIEYVLKQKLFFGGGSGTSESVLRSLGSLKLDAVHNEYVKVTVDLGLFGLLLFLKMLLLILLFINKLGYLSRHLREYYITVLLGYVVFVIGCLAHNLIYAHELAGMFFLYLGMAFRKYKMISQIKGRD